ncbi:MAG: hypothetical protein AB7I30_10215 [Isosphaeraceae bacterium]
MTSRLVLVILAVALCPRPAQAQFGGMGGGFGTVVYDHNAYQSLIAKVQAWPTKTFEIDVETIGGWKLSGAIPLAHVMVSSDLGPYAIESAKVKEVRFKSPELNQQSMMISGSAGTMVPGSVVTRSDQEVNGYLLMNQWVLKTDLGALLLTPGRLKSITFVREVPQSGTPAEDEPTPEKPKHNPGDPVPKK